MTEENIRRFSEQCNNIFKQVGRDVIGQKDVVEGTIIAMIAGGNVLLEGVPGVGKTRLVRTLGRVFNLPFSRIQFTPDLMPADVTGTNIIVKDENGNTQFQFQPGPIFANIILADEINRATPKTQSALLEAMQEHTVTVMGVSRRLNEPFFVLATQNPIEQDGTYPLPEAQMDRFMFKLIVPQPGLDDLMQIVDMTQKTMALCDDALRGYASRRRMRHRNGEKIYPSRRQPPCRSGIDFRGESACAYARQIQRGVQRSQRTCVPRTSSPYEDEFRGDFCACFSRRRDFDDYRRTQRKEARFRERFQKRGSGCDECGKRKEGQA